MENEDYRMRTNREVSQKYFKHIWYKRDMSGDLTVS